MIRGAIFDLDGVILDSLGIWWDLGERFLHAHDMKGREGLAEALFSMSMEEGASYLKGHYPLALSQKEIVWGLQKMLEDYYLYEVEEKKGASALLSFLKEKQIPMVAATSSPRLHVEGALQRLKLLSYFERIYTTEELATSKHSPEIYLKAAEFLKRNPKETLVFEDSLYALKTAKEAGFPVIGVFDAQGEPDQKGLRSQADLYVEDLGEALKDLSEYNL